MISFSFSYIIIGSVLTWFHISLTLMHLTHKESDSRDDSGTRTQHNDARRGEEEALRAGQVSRTSYRATSTSQALTLRVLLGFNF